MKDFLFEILIYLVILAIALLITVFTGFNALQNVSLFTEVVSFTVIGIFVLMLVVTKVKKRKKN